MPSEALEKITAYAVRTRSAMSSGAFDLIKPLSEWTEIVGAWPEGMEAAACAAVLTGNPFHHDLVHITVVRNRSDLMFVSDAHHQVRDLGDRVLRVQCNRPDLGTAILDWLCPPGAASK